MWRIISDNIHPDPRYFKYNEWYSGVIYSITPGISSNSNIIVLNKKTVSGIRRLEQLTNFDSAFITSNSTEHYNKVPIHPMFNKLISVFQITLQAIVLLWAVMFIVFGVPLLFCIISIPIVIVFMYFCVYATYWKCAMELSHVSADGRCRTQYGIRETLFFQFRYH